MQLIIASCPCGRAFPTTVALRNVGRGRFCSTPCFYKHRNPRPSGLTYTPRKDNPTAYKPGNTPWNKGTRKARM